LVLFVYFYNRSQDPAVLLSALRTCLSLAGNSDAERGALMNVHIVDLIGPPIRYHQADVVILACQVVENLAKTGTYRQQLIDGGIRRPLEKVVRYVNARFPKFQGA
jgi:hypothetical protein